MTNYYLDIETTGFNKEEDKIITIQFQELDKSGEVCGPLIILKEWEMGESEMIKTFYKRLFRSSNWDFVPCGTNLIFDLTFLWSKFKKYELDVCSLDEYIYNKPIIDIKHTLIIANNLEFKGSGLDQMTNKKTDGKAIPEFYKNMEYNKIESYIKNETESFIECIGKLKNVLGEAFKKNV